MNTFYQRLGLLRSILMYYGIPFRRRRLAHFYSQFMQPGDLCFDVGAHVGNRVQAWLDVGARVVAIEPQPTCLQLLQRWYGHHPNVTLIDQAVGATSGQQTLLISQRTPTVTTLSHEWIHEVQQIDSFRNVAWDATADVMVTTLDTLIAQHGTPVFCKIDVEGYELDVLRGLSDPLPALSFEYIPASKSVSLGCIERLNQLGSYHFNWSISEQHRWQSTIWLGPDEMAARLESMPVESASGDVYARQF